MSTKGKTASKTTSAQTSSTASRVARAQANAARLKARKAERVKAQDERHAANVAAGKTPKRRARPRKDNMRICLRCAYRLIPAGSVCWCRSIGADMESMRNKR